MGIMQRQISPAFHNRPNAEPAKNKKGDEVIIASPRMMTIFVPTLNTNPKSTRMAIDPPSDHKVERQNPLHSSSIFRPTQIAPGGPDKAATKAVQVSAIKARKNLPPTPNKAAAKAVKQDAFTPPKVIVVVEPKEISSDVPRMIQVPQDMATATATTTAVARNKKTPTISRARSHHSFKTPPEQKEAQESLEKTQSKLQIVSSTPATTSTSLAAWLAGENGHNNQRLVPVELYRSESSKEGSANTANKKSKARIMSSPSKNDDVLKQKQAGLGDSTKPADDVEVTATVASTTPSSIDASDRGVTVTSIVVDQQSCLRAPDPPAAMAPTTMKKTVLQDFTGMAKLRHMDQLSLSASGLADQHRRSLFQNDDDTPLQQSWPLPSSEQSRSASASLHGLPQEDQVQRRRHSTIHMTTSSRPPSSRIAIAASRPAQWLDATGTPEDWIRANASSSARRSSGAGTTNDYINLRKVQAGQSIQQLKETNPHS